MEKIKQFITSEKGKDVLVVLIVILVGLGSFELGRLSKAGTSSGIKVEYQGKETNLSANTVSALPNELKSIVKTPEATSSPSGKNFFASSRGSKYYSLGCSAGKTIKQANRIYFATSAEAESAGYTLSSSCN